MQVSHVFASEQGSRRSLGWEPGGVMTALLGGIALLYAGWVLAGGSERLGMSFRYGPRVRPRPGSTRMGTICEAPHYQNEPGIYGMLIPGPSGSDWAAAHLRSLAWFFNDLAEGSHERVFGSGRLQKDLCLFGAFSILYIE